MREGMLVQALFQIRRKKAMKTADGDWVKTMDHAVSQCASISHSGIRKQISFNPQF